MEISESQSVIIWEAIKFWIKENNLSIPLFSLQTAGTRPPYPPDRIARGIKGGSERISSDFLHTCVRVFGLVPARQRGLGDNLSDEECINLLTAPLRKNTEQSKFQL